MEDYYVLWVSESKDGSWSIIGDKGSYDEIQVKLVHSTSLSRDGGWDGSLLKIAKYGNTSWQKNIPSNIYKKVGK